MAPVEAERIKRLLRISDLSMAQIARQIGCSASLVQDVNNKWGIRIYASRTQWELKESA